MEGAAKEWGVGGRAAGIELTLTYLILPRASEMFAEDYGGVHAWRCLRMEDLAVYVDERQVEGEDSLEMYTVEVRSRQSNGNQAREGVVLMRGKGGGKKGGEAVKLWLELYRIYNERVDLPLIACRGYGGGR